MHNKIPQVQVLERRSYYGSIQASFLRVASDDRRCRALWLVLPYSIKGCALHLPHNLALGTSVTTKYNSISKQMGMQLADDEQKVYIQYGTSGRSLATIWRDFVFMRCARFPPDPPIQLPHRPATPPISPLLRRLARNTFSLQDTSAWVYPSEQQYYNAIRRKGYKASAQDMPMTLAIHNAVNEQGWTMVTEWERLHSGGGADTPAPKLLRFQGRPKDMSPKAWIKTTLLGYTPPFDRLEQLNQNAFAFGVQVYVDDRSCVSLLAKNCVVRGLRTLSSLDGHFFCFQGASSLVSAVNLPISAVASHMMYMQGDHGDY